MDPNSSLGKICLGENIVEISSDKVEGSRDWNSLEFQDTANSGGKKEMKAMVFHQIDTKEVSDRFVTPCFVNGLKAYDGEINLGVEENMISNEYAVKLCVKHEVKRGNKVVKKELIVPQPPHAAPRTMPQRIARIEEEVHELRQSIVGLRGDVDRMVTDLGRLPFDVSISRCDDFCDLIVHDENKHGRPCCNKIDELVMVRSDGMEKAQETPVINDLTMVLGSISQPSGIIKADNTACRTLIQKYSLGDHCRLFVADEASFSLIPIRAHSEF
ncbi:hypothetical protein Tco_1575286 [Tanacetum coccineum]